MNKSFYSFGGRTPIKSSYNKTKPVLNQTFTSMLSKDNDQQGRTPIIIKKDPIVRV
jgi:hypothetical protein